MTLAWLDEFLPLMRCPNSKEALRLATTEECAAVGLPSDAQALANTSGNLIYPIIDNMPHLLPTSALNPNAAIQR